MWKLDLPTTTVEELFKTCTNAIEFEIPRKRQASTAPDVIAAEQLYQRRAQDQKLYLIPEQKILSGAIKALEMKSLYTSQMVPKGSVGRETYDLILSAPKNSICPLCGHLPVSTMDHYLPIGKFPIYAITPMNLVPACKDCNTNKLSTSGRSAEKQTIHPYFDDITTQQWLYATIIEQLPMVVQFDVRPPSEWNITLQKRVAYHFALLKLNRLYVSNAGQELLNIRDTLISMYNTSGVASLRDHLEGAYQSRRKNNINSWQTALYQALAGSTWLRSGRIDQKI